MKVEGYPSMEWPTSLDIPLKASALRGTKSKSQNLHVCGYTGDSFGSLSLYHKACDWIVTQTVNLNMRGLTGDTSENIPLYINQFLLFSKSC